MSRSFRTCVARPGARTRSGILAGPRRDRRDDRGDGRAMHRLAAGTRAVTVFGPARCQREVRSGRWEPRSAYSLHSMVKKLSSLAPLALALALSGLAGCDNPACVFGPGNCSGSGGGGFGDAPASLPVDAEWIVTARPVVDRIAPGSTPAVDTRAPIAIFFSESMSSSGLSGAFELQPLGGFPIPLPTAVLAGNGRVLILLPPTQLQLDTQFDLVHVQDADVADRTGQTVLWSQNGLVGSFTTAATAPAAPRVLATFPPDNGAQHGATTEIVVVFDRPIDGGTMSTSSFVVTVDGVAPTENPEPTAIGLAGVASDSRVWRWRSVDSNQVPVPLGAAAGAHVVVTLSPAGNSIEAVGGAVLPTTTFDFDVAPFSAPTAASITSAPSDGIGIDDISGAAELAVEVDLLDAQAGDQLSLWMFGREPNVPVSPQLIALHREVPLVPPFTSFTMTAQEIDLLLSASPVRGRFADGAITFAFQVRRGANVSPVRLLDVDPAKTGVQSPVLDTVAPVILGLGTSGSAAGSFVSDQRDLVLVGRASETLRRAEVVTPLGDNALVPGEVAPVVGSHSGGLFVAAPVPLGVLDPADQPVSYTLTVYDRALNPATVSSAPIGSGGGFRQVGASGPGSAPPAGPIAVAVFDATTLAPVAGAALFTHENLGGVVFDVPLGTATTDLQGLATIPAAPLGETILTVVAAGYDLFTFDNLPTDRIGIPLQPTVLASATASGTVNSTSTFLNLLTKNVADSRVPEIGPTVFPVAPCAFDSPDQRFECPFGPISIRPRRIGTQCAHIVLPPPDPLFFTALTFLKGFELSIPVPPANPGTIAAGSITLPFLFDEPGVDAEERPLDAPPLVLSSALWPGLPAGPIVRVEATSPGLPGTSTVGQGVSFDDFLPPDTWGIRAAYPGAVDGTLDSPTDELGRLVTSGTVDGDLLLRAEVVDADGNRGGARPRFSLAPATLVPPAAAFLATTTPPVNGGGFSFDLAFEDVLPDAALEPGLYRVTLVDAAGRRWTIWTPDRPDAAGPDAVVNVPYVGAGNTFPLAAEDVDCRISAYAWPALDVALFLWSDVEREHDLFSHSRTQTFTPPDPP